MVPRGTPYSQASTGPTGLLLSVLEFDRYDDNLQSSAVDVMNHWIRCNIYTFTLMILLSIASHPMIHDVHNSVL